MRDAIFLSYRRSDASTAAGRIHDRLAARWPDDRLFMDVEGIAPGEDFTHVLDETLARARVVLVVIGPGWLDASRDGQRRLDDPTDWVRTEVARALATAEVAVIPVLVDGAELPSADALPEPLKPLAVRNAWSVRSDRFALDMEPLEARLAALVPVRSRGWWMGAIAAAVVVGLAVAAGSVLLGAPVCGDGEVEGEEACDDGGPTSHCTAQCTEIVCGDARREGEEACDDGNTAVGDGCDAACRTEACGNGRLDAGEACDDGNTAVGDGCDAACRTERCGNGRLDAGEACDDGNTAPRDRCTPDCQIAPPRPKTPYFLVNSASGHVLQMVDNGNGAGNYAELKAASKSADAWTQQWYFVPTTSGAFVLVNRNAEYRNLNVGTNLQVVNMPNEGHQGAEKKAGFVLHTWEAYVDFRAEALDVPDARATFRVRDVGGGMFTVQSVGSGMMLQFSGRSQGSSLVQHPDRGVADQRWRLVPAAD